MMTMCNFRIFGILLFSVALSSAVNSQSSTDSAIRRGEYLVTSVGNCGNCHTKRGPDLMPSGETLSGGVIFDSPAYGLAYSKNITPDVDTGIGSWTPAQIVRAIREGVTKEGSRIGEPMPVRNLSALSDEDAAAIAAYLKTIKPIRNEVPESKYKIKIEEVPPVSGVSTPSRNDKVKYGEYLATIAHCNECHTPPGPNGGPRNYEKEMGAGGRVFFPLPKKPVRSANITPDKETGIGGWSDAEIKRALTQGVSRNGRKLNTQMPYPYFQHMTDEDLDAVVAYLRTMQPVSNRVAPNLDLVEYIKDQR